MSDTDREPLSQLTQLLNEAFSIGAEISGDGALHLRMDDDLGVSVAPTPDREDIVFCAILADLTRGRTVATMAAAMSLNLYQEGTRGGALALDMGTQTVVFCWRVAVSAVPTTDWIIALENFCATAVSLRSSLEGIVGEFSEEELQNVEDRAAHEPDLSELGLLAALTPTTTRPDQNIIRG